MLKVTKFGGSSMADAGQYRKVREILQADPGRKVVIVSAAGKRDKKDNKITDLLYLCHAHSQYGVDCGGVFELITSRYLEIRDELGINLELEQEFAGLKQRLDKKTITQDELVSRGEYFSAKLMAAFLDFEFVDAADWIRFNMDGTVDKENSYELLQSQVRGKGVVIPGFYGVMPDGHIRTFSRGGSDITGALAAAALDADVYENWTDVSGMLMADPRIVKNPRVIEEITYRELRELAYMGASVMHEETVFPVKEANIPINIRNTNAPEEPGTMIVPNSDKIDVETVITGVAGRKGFSSVTVEKSRMNTEVGFGRKLLGCIEQMGISIEHVPSGIDMMSVILGTNTIENCREELTARIFRDTGADSVLIEDGIALVCVVGRGMVRAKGTAARIFSAIARENINIRMIDQFAGEKNIILGVNEDELEKTLQIIYSEFVKD